ncbi:DUF2809 domain-containing protein [Xenophilus aerolatus]|nr:DUF2809 domain-containing protein [Xenophilus aerolatus]
MSAADSFPARRRFDAGAAAWALGLFVVLVLLATVGARWGVVRSFGGDVLAVACVYCLLKTVWRAPVVVLALTAFGVGVAVEACQWMAAAQHWHIQNRALRIVLGSTADVWDVVAYALGALLAVGAQGLARTRAGRR